MTTPLDKTLKREVQINGRAFIVALSPEGLKLTLKGKRRGQELRWADLVSGDAALAVALNASLGEFAPRESPKKSASPKKLSKARANGRNARTEGRARRQPQGRQRVV